MIIIQDKKYWTKVFLMFLFLLVVCPQFVNAVAPITSFTSQFTEGLALDFFALPALKINSGFILNIHAYNLSDGLVVSSPLSSCKVHLLSPNGSEIEVQHATPFQDHFRFSIDNNNITKVGYYSYSLQCNTSNLGGYRSGGFFVNLSGIEPPTDFTKIFFIIIFIILLALTAITVIFLVHHLEQADMDMWNLMTFLGIYFANLSMKYFNLEYMGSVIINRFADLFIKIGAFTHILLPIVIFIYCFAKRRLELKEEDV